MVTTKCRICGDLTDKNPAHVYLGGVGIVTRYCCDACWKDQQIRVMKAHRALEPLEQYLMGEMVKC